MNKQHSFMTSARSRVIIVILISGLVWGAPARTTVHTHKAIEGEGEKKTIEIPLFWRFL